MIKLYQRPIPRAEQNSTIWIYLINMYMYVSILFNSGMIGHLSSQNADLKEYYLMIFVVIFLASILIRYSFEIFQSKVPNKLRMIIKRQQYIIKNSFEQFFKST